MTRHHTPESVNKNVSGAKPLTREEVHQAAHRRLSKIHQEFKAAFSFISKYPKSVTFFGSSRLKENNPHYIEAMHLARRLSESGYTIVTGGGPGIMEAANRGAFEARGQSVGLNIRLHREQKENKYLTDSMEFHYFFTRKVALSFAAEAYIFFPGGFGTLDEFFEIITLLQTRKIRHVPVILVGSDYWSTLQKFITDEVLNQHRAISPNDIKLYTITDDEEEILRVVHSVPVLASVTFAEKNRRFF